MDLLNLRREGAVLEKAIASPVAPTPPEPRAATATILVIDDDPGIRRLYSRFLGQDGHRMLVAGNGHVGIELAQRERPDLIILDIKMAGMDGLTVLKHLKADPLTERIRVILVTGMDVPDTMIEATAAYFHVGAIYTKGEPLYKLKARVEAELGMRVRPILNEDLCQVSMPGSEPVPLCPKRFLLLKELMASPEGVSCSRLINVVWAGLGDKNTLKTTIGRLRADLGAFDGCRIETTKDGYRLKISQ